MTPTTAIVLLAIAVAVLTAGFLLLVRDVRRRDEAYAAEVAQLRADVATLAAHVDSKELVAALMSHQDWAFGHGGANGKGRNLRILSGGLLLLLVALSAGVALLVVRDDDGQVAQPGRPAFPPVTAHTGDDPETSEGAPRVEASPPVTGPDEGDSYGGEPAEPGPAGDGGSPGTTHPSGSSSPGEPPMTPTTTDTDTATDTGPGTTEPPPTTTEPPPLPPTEPPRGRPGGPLEPGAPPEVPEVPGAPSPPAPLPPLEVPAGGAGPLRLCADVVFLTVELFSTCPDRESASVSRSR